MTASNDYSVQSVDALLGALEVAGQDPHPDLIRAILDRAPEVVPGLLEMFAADPDGDWPDDDPRWYRDAHAGLLLCALCEPAALPIFARLLRAQERDSLSEWYGIALPWYYGPLAVPTLIGLAQDTDAPDNARFAALDMLSFIGVHHSDQGPQIAEALRTLLPPFDREGQLVLTPEEREDPPVLWTWVVNGLMSLRDAASRPQVEALFEADVIYEYVFGGLKDYLAVFGPDAQPPLYAHYSYDILEEYESLYQERQMEERRRAQEAQLEDKESRMKLFRRGPDVRPKQDGVAIDLSQPRKCVYRRFTDDPGPCPQCGDTLHQRTLTYLVATRRGSKSKDSLIMSNDMGWYCAQCPTVVINTKELDIGSAHPMRDWDVGNEFAVLGILDLDAIPREQAHLPLGEIDPLPLVPFDVTPGRERASGSGHGGKPRSKRRKVRGKSKKTRRRR